MGHDFSFEIPRTPENKAALEKIKKEFLSGPMTIYADCGTDGVIPICDVSRHEDCPPEIYEAFIKYITR